MTIGGKRWIRMPLHTIRLKTNVTWAEVGLWTIVIIGSLLGALKRYLPGPAIVITIGYDVLCFGLLAYVMVKRLSHSRVIPYSPITPVLFAFIAFVALTIINPQITSLVRGLIGWRFLASSILLHYLGFYAFNDEKRIWRFLNILWLGGGIVALYGLVQMIRGYTPVELAWISNLASPMQIAGTGRYRLMATLGGAFDLGFFMTLNIITLFGSFLIKRNAIFFRTILFLLTINALIFTYVRTSWIAVMVGCAYLVFVRFWSSKNLRLLLPSLLSLLLIVGILMPTIFRRMSQNIENPALKERISSLANPLKDKSVINRIDKWQTITGVVQLYPMGVGVGMTGATSLRYPNDPSPAPVTMDNSYLKVLVETGWIGLFLYLLLLFSIIYKGMKIARRLDERTKVLAYTFVAIFLSYLVLQFFGEYIELNPSRSVIWILSGFLFSLPRYQSNT